MKRDNMDFSMPAAREEERKEYEKNGENKLIKKNE